MTTSSENTQVVATDQVVGIKYILTNTGNQKLDEYKNKTSINLGSCEDKLKSFYNIPTKIPKCPCPGLSPIIPEMCAASDKSAIKHEDAKVDVSTISGELRVKLIKEMINKFKYMRLILYKPKYVKNIHKKYVFGDNLFNLSDIFWKDVLFWQ